MTPPTDYPDDVTALSRLVLCGWSGTPIGDPHAPEALVYLRDGGVFVDAVLVSGPTDAVATRRDLFGTVVRRERGDVVSVVGEVLGW